MQTLSLNETFIVLDADQACHAVPVGPTLYQDIDRDFDGFKKCALIAEYTFDRDWPTWEKHPHGDEVLYLLSGKAVITVLIDQQPVKIDLSQSGKACIIPRDCWHTAQVIETCRILFITPGQGTLNALEPDAV